MEKKSMLLAAGMAIAALAPALCAADGATDGFAADSSAKFPATLKYKTGGRPDVMRLDLGPASSGGYAVFSVSSRKGDPVLRVSYANHPNGLGPKGCFSRETRARYLGPKVDIPALPGNLNRHELYSICRTGVFAAPLIQGQARYVRLQLDTPGEVEISSFALENAETFRKGTFNGSFQCADPRLDELWKISAWTCQIASFPNHDAWKCAGGKLMPRKLEQASGEGWCKTAAPCNGTLSVEYEFAANPHFPKGAFDILAGSRRVRVAQTSTNEILTATASVRAGERFGLAVEKESWPQIARISICDAAGRTVWECDFGRPGALAGWDFPRTLPYIADGAKRDRLIWSGDLWWAERNVFYSFNPADDAYMRGCVDMLAANQNRNGYIHACPYPERSTPPEDGDYGPFPSDEFAAWFMPVLYDYALYSGDLATLRRLYPKAKKLMAYLESHTRPDGTFVQRRETSKHACNLSLGDVSHRSYMDILLWKCWTDAAAAAAALQMPGDSARFAAKAARLAASIRATFWNAGKKYFALSDRDRGFGFEANALALATGFATRGEALAIAPRLKRTGHGKFQALAVRGLYEYGFADRALAAIEAHNWFKLLDPSWKGARTTTECMSMTRGGWGDESHPDTAIAGILSAGTLGAEPLVPGWKKFRFRPLPCARMQWAKGRIPTPHGTIAAEWKMEGDVLRVSLAVPQGTTAIPELPRCRRIVCGDGSLYKPGTPLAGGKTWQLAAEGVSPEALVDPVRDGAGDAKAPVRYSASSSQEAGVWSIRNLEAGADRRRTKGWSSKANPSPDCEEWVLVDLGAVESVEKLRLLPRNDRDSRKCTAGFPRSFVVESVDAAGATHVLKTFENAEPPPPGKTFDIDFYTVIGYPKTRYIRIRARKLGATATDEPGAWRLQFKEVLPVTAGGK